MLGLWARCVGRIRSRRWARVPSFAFVLFSSTNSRQRWPRICPQSGSQLDHRQAANIPSHQKRRDFAAAVSTQSIRCGLLICQILRRQPRCYRLLRARKDRRSAGQSVRQVGKRMDQDVVERHQRGLRHAPVAAQVVVARSGCTRIRWAGQGLRFCSRLQRRV